MESEILKLIYDYSVNGKLVDSIFVDKLIEIVVSERNINDYVRLVSFTNRLEKNEHGVTCAAYNPLWGIMLIDFVSINIMIERSNYYNQMFQSYEQIMLKNLTITQCVLHELEHAFQRKQFDNKSDNSIEAKLVKASLALDIDINKRRFLDAISKCAIFKLQNRNQLYKQYYIFDPTERLAEINSYRTIVNLIEPIKKHIPNLYEVEQDLLFKNMLSGYTDSWNQGSCPTQVYLFGTRQKKVWTKMDFYDKDSSQLMKNVSEKYDLTRRLSLGLPVSHDEYNNFKKDH